MWALASGWHHLVTVFLAQYLPWLLVIILLVYLGWAAIRGRGKSVADLVIFSLCSAVLSMLVATMLQVAYTHPRPFLTLVDLMPLVPVSGENSFPSAHAAFFFALATAAYARGRSGWGRVLTLAALLISVARVAAAVHWPGDIIAGALLGVAIACLTQFLYNLSTHTDLS